MIYPAPAVFYKNASAPPEVGDEFIEVTWEENLSGFEVFVIRGKFQGESFPGSPARFATRDAAEEWFTKRCIKATEDGFAWCGRTHFIRDGKPL